MNEKFFFMSVEKRLAIINAGYHIFSKSSYKKSPMSEIAAEAGISKSLLFYYFNNKRELYLYLLNSAIETTYRYIDEFGCYEEDDFFDNFTRGIKAKAEMMKKYPDIAAFTIKAHYETDLEVCADIKKIIERTTSFENNAKALKINPDQLIEGIDIRMMYTEMYYASEGYLWEKTQRGVLNAVEAERDFEKMIEFWKKIYLRK